MPSVTTAIVGAGQSGLAMSRYLSESSVDHVLLERGEIAHSWRTERWDSLRLLTPNWLNRLPGHCYEGDDPDGYMTMPEVVHYVTAYAAAISAPVVENTEVTSVHAVDGGFLVTTPETEWHARTVVLASGPSNSASVPSLAGDIPSDVRCLTPLEYRNPRQLDDGGVLIVGAAATGVQLAQEIQASGRPVTLAVGAHVRLPRVYRGMDILWWLDAAGILDEGYQDVDDVGRVRNLPSFQLVGAPARPTVDLNALQGAGVTIVGRLAGITGEGMAQFSGSLPNQCALADLKLARLLDRLDRWAAGRRLEAELCPPERFAPTGVPSDPTLSLSLRSGEIKTVIWATGYRPDYPWLDVPVLDAKGRVRHDGGVTPVPGLYLIGGAFLRRRTSTFIDGAGDDARDLSSHLLGYLDEVARVS